VIAVLGGVLMRARWLVLMAASTLGLVTLPALARAGGGDDWKWDRTKKLTPKVGDKFVEWGTEQVSGSKKGANLDVRYKLLREVKAVDGVATEEAVISVGGDYRVYGLNGDSVEPDMGDPFGSHFSVKGTAVDRTFTYFKTQHKIGADTEIAPCTRRWIERKWKKADPLVFTIIECLLPEGPIAAEQKWTVDPKKVAKVAFGGVELGESPAEIVGSLTNVRLENGIHVGHLKVETQGNEYDGGLLLKKDPETGETYDTSDMGHYPPRGTIGLEGDISLEGSLSLDGATRMDQLSVNVFHKGRTEEAAADEGTQRGTHSWMISFDRDTSENK
jgi:hypothetical protein